MNILESEKERIIGMHNVAKKNPTTRLIKESLNDFPFCVRNTGVYQKETEREFIFVKDGGGKGKDYYYYKDGSVVEHDNNDRYNREKIWHCKCVNGKCKVSIDGRAYINNVKQKPLTHECDNDTSCSSPKQQQNNNTNKSGGEENNCGSKTPYQAITDMGMNFKDTQLKWINANCNGTTPCIKGNSNTNINLKDAVCSGSWNPDGGSNTSGGGGDESTSNDEVIDDGTWSGDIY
jgi:hypothetical protein